MTEPNGNSALESPFPDGLALDGLEDQVLDDKADDDHGEQPGEDRRNVEQVAVLEDEPSKSALARRYAEHEFRRDQGPPSEGPANFQSGQDRWEGRRNQDPEHVGQAF